MKYTRTQEKTAAFGLLILSRIKALEFTEGADQNTILVRIAGGGDGGGHFPPLPLEANYLEVKKFVFDDVTGPNEALDNSTYFPNGPITSKQAEELSEFLIKNIHHNLVVHCEAGISRSSAVGLFWAHIKEDKLLYEIIEESAEYWPNNYVYSKLLATIA